MNAHILVGLIYLSKQRRLHIFCVNVTPLSVCRNSLPECILLTNLKIRNSGVVRIKNDGLFDIYV